VTGITAPRERLCYSGKRSTGFGRRAIASLMLFWGIRFAKVCWLALRFCAAVVLGLAIVGAVIVVWVIADLVLLATSCQTPQRARY
jgi:hypothetical protein